MNKLKQLTRKQLFLPVFCVILVLCANIIYDLAQGNAFYNFFTISVRNGVLYGRIIDILNRGSEVAILVIGVVFGLFQGFCVSYLNIQPFIVTMAGMFFARGMTAVISTKQMSITQEANATFYAWANAKINLPAFLGYANKKGIIQVPYIRVGVIVALLVLVIIFLVLRYTRFGRALYAVGGSEQSAAMMGLDVKKTKLKAYMLSSFLCSVGGICYCLNTMQGSVQQATGLEMDAIASSVIGGTLLTGGVGNVLGSFVGVLINGTISSIVKTNGKLASS